MTIQTLTLQVPDVLYTRLRQRAEQANRTVEAETLDLLATTVPVAEELPPDLEQALAALKLLADRELWQVARSRLAVERVAELEALNDKRQREGLTEAETQTAAELLRQYERSMLLRAQAAAQLKERGHDIADLVTPP